jgi:hypothetical protein
MACVFIGFGDAPGNHRRIELLLMDTPRTDRRGFDDLLSRIVQNSTYLS